MKIVVGFVISDESQAALDWAIEEAHRRDAEIIVVHSIHGGGRIDSEEEEILKYRKALDEVEQRLTNENLPHSVRRLIRGQSPAEDLIQTASEEAADMIVIGHRRRSPTGKLFLGSNAQEILLDAECPVVAVKARRPAR